MQSIEMMVEVGQSLTIDLYHWIPVRLGGAVTSWGAEITSCTGVRILVGRSF